MRSFTPPILCAILIFAFVSPAGADNPAITVNVNATANVHPIESGVYGAAWASAAEINAFGLTLNRWGGNAMSRSNSIYSTANRCKDYYFFNIPDAVSSVDDSNGKSADDFIGSPRRAAAQPGRTIPMPSPLPQGPTQRRSVPQSQFSLQTGLLSRQPAASLD